MTNRRLVGIAWGLAGFLLAPILLGRWLSREAQKFYYTAIHDVRWSWMGLSIGDIVQGWEVTAIDEEYGPDGADVRVRFEKRS